MATGYKDYNNYSQQDKESMMAYAADTSNTNETTIIAQTDQVESLLSSLVAKLDTLAGKIDTLNGKIDTLDGSVDLTTAEVKTQGEAIVAAINNQQ